MSLRWWIGGLLFASTVINYIDRQTLNALAPVLKNEFHWSNADFATVLISFRLAYTIMQGVGGRIMDLMGTRNGLTASVAFYSTIGVLTAFAQGIGSFRAFRFLLGVGEGPNWPGAAKTVAEWFPDKERAWAVALFDSGSALGGLIAPFLALWAYHSFGNWRAAFVITGLMGFAWILAWRIVNRTQGPYAATAGTAHFPWARLLGYKQTWGIVVGRSLLDPYWFLVADWFAIYLSSKGFSLESSAIGFWVPFLGADLGNFFGGGLSSWLIGRGWSVGKARRLVLGVFGPTMLALIPAAYADNYWIIVLLFGYASFAYAACATIFLSLPGDVFHPRAVGSVSGLSGVGAGLGTLLSTYLIGQITDRFSFQPVIITASLIPCVATAVLLWLVRSSEKPDDEGILRKF